MSRDIPRHLGPGTLGNVLGGTSRDVPGHPRTFGTWDSGQCPRWGHPGTSRDIPGHFGTWDSGQCPRWGHPRMSRDIPGHPRTFGTWDSGQCPRWGHPGMSRDIPGLLGPGTLGNILGGTS